MIGILDLDIGNLRNVTKAIDALGFDCALVDQAAQLEPLSHLVIPGVGAYSTAARHLDEKALRGAVQAFAKSGRPVLGICLGMEILSEHGEEGGDSDGLGLVPGVVRRMAPGPGVDLPHVGWNGLRFHVEHPVFRGVKSGVDFYFVHSYAFDDPDPACVYASTSYGREFPSIVGRRNVVGLQFHPEKSQSNGLRLLENFCNWDGSLLSVRGAGG